MPFTLDTKNATTMTLGAEVAVDYGLETYLAQESSLSDMLTCEDGFYIVLTRGGEAKPTTTYTLETEN